jgi:4-alpha-glucanotransferase
MNLPGTTGGNWTWRIPADADLAAVSAELLNLNVRYHR